MQSKALAVILHIIVTDGIPIDHSSSAAHTNSPRAKLVTQYQVPWIGVEKVQTLKTPTRPHSIYAYTHAHINQTVILTSFA